MKRILLSGGLLVFAAVIAVNATGAFFSDTETSTGNTFTAGDIDLQIDNESYVTSTSTGLLVASPANSWAMSNLTNQLFFSFTDVKPGDIGEDTISVHAGSNDAFACMAADITATPENTLVDPEVDAGDVGPAAGDNGELQTFINFSFWNDDGDNVFETGENQITALTGTAATIFNGAWSAITGTSTPIITAGSTRYVAKAWCFGTLTGAPIAQDGIGKTAGSTNGPLVRGTGYTCNGAGNNNVAQTDGIVVDVAFQSVQARNNANFSCASLPPFNGTSTPATSTEVNVVAENLGFPNWYFYDDSGDTINNALGSFVAGPGTPPTGTGSAQMTATSSTARILLTNSTFGGVKLASTTVLSFTEWSQSGGVAVPNEAPFFRFNVDFNFGAGYQNSLVYVPANNGAIVKDSWQTWNMIAPTANWLYSGSLWPAGLTSAGNIPGTTARTMSAILADYPNIRMHPAFAQLGFRVGEPGPAAYTGNIDSFSIATGGPTTTYDFGN